MNLKIKKIFTNVRVIILLVTLVLAIIAINPKPGAEGVIIRNLPITSEKVLFGILEK